MQEKPPPYCWKAKFPALSVSDFFSVQLWQEVGEMRNQIAQSGVQVDVDAPKGQDMSQVMEEMRANYEKQALKNAEELKMWHESQVQNPWPLHDNNFAMI